MKPRYFFWTLSLIAVFAASSCAPAVTDTPASPVGSVAPATETLTSAPHATLLQPTVPGVTATQALGVEPAATSRGPDLEATDPTTVNLASGQLQLVEFFRFT
jgi:hypothetical protein